MCDLIKDVMTKVQQVAADEVTKVICGDCTERLAAAVLPDHFRRVQRMFDILVKRQAYCRRRLAATGYRSPPSKAPWEFFCACGGLVGHGPGMPSSRQFPPISPAAR
jgi:hypothetical protein